MTAHTWISRELYIAVSPEPQTELTVDAEENLTARMQRCGVRIDVAFLLLSPAAGRSGSSDYGACACRAEPNGERYPTYMVLTDDWCIFCHETYACSDGGTGIRRYWRCVWEAEVMEGMLYSTVSLRIAPVRSMSAADPCCICIYISLHGAPAAGAVEQIEKSMSRPGCGGCAPGTPEWVSA